MSARPRDDWELGRAIARQPDDFRAVLAAFGAPSFRDAVAKLGPARRVFLVGIGSSHHAAEVGAYLFREAGLDARAVHSADFGMYRDRLGSTDAVVVISHRGTKQYSVSALQAARAAGAWSVCVTGNGSPLADEPGALCTVEQERSSTHSTSCTSAMVLLARLAAELAPARLMTAVQALPDLATETLVRCDGTSEWAARMAGRRRTVFVGAGPLQWTAQETSLKVRETSYVVTEAMSVEALLHGPLISLDERDTIVLFDGPDDYGSRSEGLRNAAAKIGTEVLRVGFGGVPGDLTLPDRFTTVASILGCIPGQLLALDCAILRGTNPDSFRLDVPKYADAMRGLRL